MRTNTKMPNANPMIVKSIPPVFSHFQAMISVASRTNVGIRCIKKARAFCMKVRSEENESNANRLMKRMAQIQSILAVQESAFVDVFIMNCKYVTTRYEINYHRVAIFENTIVKNMLFLRFV